MTEEASLFIKDTAATVQLEDYYAPFLPKTHKTKNAK